MRLTLIRHAETPANVLGSLDTSLPGPGLTEHGREQAHAVVAAIAPDRPEGLWVSPALRTHETARPLAVDLGLLPTVLPGAHEIYAGDLEKRTDPESIQRYLEVLWSWANGDLGLRMPGAENGHEVLDRFDASVAAIAGSGAQHAVLFSHGAIIRIWTAIRSVNLGTEFVRDNPLANTGVVELEGEPASGWVLRSWMGSPIGHETNGDPYDGPTGHPLPD